MTDPLPDAIPAATLVLFREGAGAPELLMVERSRAMVFAGGALVFPGGRIDPADHIFAATLPGDEEDNAARIAAIRETIEEAGVPVGLSPLLPEVFARLRAALHDGTPFAQALAEAGATLTLDALIPFARWRPRHAHMRIFDTRFFIARLPEDSPEAQVDATENSRVFWASAQSILDDADAGRARIIFPTRRNLERLAQHASFDEVAAAAIALPQRIVTPWAEERGGQQHLCIPDDLGYPVTSELLADAERG